MLYWIFLLFSSLIPFSLQYSNSDYLGNAHQYAHSYEDSLDYFDYSWPNQQPNQHNINKREIPVTTMKDYLKFLIRGNKTSDDDRNIDPYVAGNLTLGITTDGTFTTDRNGIVAIFKNLPQTNEIQYLQNQSFKISFFSPNDRPIPDVNAILSFLPCEIAKRFDRLLIGKPIIHIAITSNNCPRTSRPSTLILPVQKEGNELPQIFTDLRLSDTLQWKEAIVVGEEYLDNELFNGVVESLGKTAQNRRPLTLTTLRLFGPVALRKKNFEIQLQSLPLKKLGQNFIFIARQETALWAIDAATEIGLLNADAQWFLVLTDPANSTDTSIFLPTMEDGQNVAFLFNTSTHTADYDDILQCFAEAILDIYTQALYQVVKEEEIQYFQVSEEEWKDLKPSTSTRNDNVIHRFHMMWKTSQKCASSLSWKLQAVEMKVRNQPSLVEVGVWDGSHGLEVRDDLFPHISGGLRGREILVTSLEFPPWEVYERDDKGRIISYTGLIFELVKELGRRMNFTFKVIPPPDGQWGTRLTFSRWTGMIEMVRQGKVEFAAAGFTVTPDRMSVVNFSVSIDTQPYTFTFARPKQLSRALLFIQPYNTDVRKQFQINPPKKNKH